MIALAMAAFIFAGSEVLLPGQADLPLMRGARLAPECAEVLPADREGPALTCIAVPMRRANDMVFAYSRQAQRQGWQDAGGAASALFLTRPATPERCAQRLTLIAFWDPARADPPAPNEDVFIGMAVESQNCKEAG
ncbi:hypothetical protein HNP47_002961 [Brevundimonas vesicularis]|uniref:Uncharacterized protein n=1 Tax=Brevundimonas vesicularis TaxID=41276 RepID=A0A7W9FWV3_BREVE|nr:hypothetical protein [Brevundimonas vesicularis]MBB5772941.1 hypothetical protein [Brevundimonas vesicularis]